MIVQNLLNLTDEFIQLLRIEAEHLWKKNLTEAGLLHEEKDRLNGEYQLAVAQFKKHKDSIIKLNPDQWQQLYDKTSEMKLLMEKNRDEISLFARANSIILNALVDKLTEKSRPVPGYTARGVMTEKSRHRVEALTFNSQI